MSVNDIGVLVGFQLNLLAPTKDEVSRLMVVALVKMLKSGQELEIRDRRGTIGKLTISSFILSIQNRTIPMLAYFIDWQK